MATTVKRRRDVRLYRSIAKAATPAVIVLALVALAVYHFRGVLAITQSQDDLFHGVYSMSQGDLEVDFQRDAGLDRPVILFNRTELMSFSDWDSQIVIDGHNEELWNNFHGYTFDLQHNQIFATTSGYGWQLTATTTLVDSHTVTITYEFTARHVGVAEPHQVVLDIRHQHEGRLDVSHFQTANWFNPSVGNNEFSGEELSVDSQNPVHPPAPDQYYTAYPIGFSTLSVSGPDLSSTPIVMQDYGTTMTSTGAKESWVSTFTTQYVINDPPVDALTTVGTETFTFQPVTTASPGSPIVLPLPNS